tara:strand:- start:1306 stop:1917 length:612 start_codon:yes stop_codon:yes gene_type:complete
VSVLNRPSLRLNKNWTPVDIDTVKKSLIKVFCGQALIIDTDDYQTYDFEGWAELPLKDGDDFIQTTSSRVRVPEVILLTQYGKIPFFDVKLTRKNLLIRDGHRCAYTNKPLTPRTATIDHIRPKSRGGRNDWNNVVIASLEANSRKGNRTPSQAGMKLLRTPHAPTWSPLFTSCLSSIPESWKQFIKSDKVVDLMIAGSLTED